MASRTMSREMNDNAVARVMSRDDHSASYDRTEFASSSFDSNSFLEHCRQPMNLQTLKKDLLQDLSALKKAVVTLINRDYADFVNLSAHLSGLDKAIAAIQAPLLAMQTEIATVEEEISMAIKQLDTRLADRSLIREKKALLQVYLNVAASVNKIEKLLFIGGHKKTEHGHEDAEEGLQAVERVTSEFNQLLFYVSQVKDLAFGKMWSKRVNVITDTLLANLETSYRTGLAANDMSAVAQCFRTYAIIDMADKAEELYRTTVVSPYIKKHLTAEKLKANGLESLYDDMVTFIDSDCATVQSMTDKEGLHHFNFLAKAVWPEIASVLTNELPTVLSPGVPDVFYKNYSSTMAFVDKVEHRLGTRAAVAVFRTSLCYQTFMKAWPLPVYFQLRLQEVAGDFEECLPVDLLAHIENQETENSNGLLLDTSIHLSTNMDRVWADGVFLPALGHRFWKLYLQLLSRHSTYLGEVKQMFLSELQKAKDKAANGMNNSSKDNGLGALALFLVRLASDLRALLAKVSSMVPIVQGRLAAITDIPDSFVQGGVDVYIENTTDILEAISQTVAAISALWCKANLKPVWRVTAAYRMTSKEMPTTASSYVSEILQPHIELLHKQSKLIPADEARQWSLLVGMEVTSRYATMVEEVLTTVDKTEASLLRLKRSRKGNKTSTTSLLGTDEDRIRRQLYLDVVAYADQLQLIGLKTEEVADFQRLWDCVQVGSDQTR